ncbi:MAG: sugar-transfer associated ATP-grasp domain-containing protein [Oscillospiraceae bacterium]
MGISTKIRNFKRMIDQMNWDSITGGSKADFLLKLVLFGISGEQYFSNELYKANLRICSTFLTRRDNAKIGAEMKSVATKEEWDWIANKYQFNTKFAKFIKREYLHIDESTLEEEIVAFIRKHGTVLSKELNNTQGKGIKRISFDPTTTQAVVKELRQGEHLVEQFIVQHSDMIKINPTSVNTIRIGTVLDKNHKAHVIGATLRAGGKDKFVDNFHSGGVAYPVDFESGIVCGKGRNNTSGTGFIRHPSTDFKVLGFEVPNYDIAKKTVMEAAEMLDKLYYIGWDVAITPDGVELIEANIGQAADVIQLDLIGKRKWIRDRVI